MSASSPGPGRPPGISEATLEKQRRVREMDKLGVARATIAAVEKCSIGYVGMLINGGAKEDGSPESAADIEPPQPRRLSRRAAQYRAWEIVQQRPAPGLGLDANAFWIRLIVEIHETGDGVRLGIGEPASRFSTRSDLAVLFGRPDQLQIDDWLAALVERGRLIDVGEVDIGIPPGMKLTPAENIRGKKRPAQAPQDGQAAMLHALPGGLSDATEIPPQTQIKTPLNLHPGATEIASERKFNSNSIPPVGDGLAAAAAAYAKESQSLSSSSSTGSRADASDPSGNIICIEGGISVAADANLIPPAGATETPDASLINPKRSPVAVLTEELVALAGLNRAPNADDLSIVETWLEAGETRDTLTAGIEIKMGQRKGKPPTMLRYFDGFLTERRDARRRRPASTVIALPQSAAPAPPVSDADRALRDLLKPSADAWIKDRSCPFAPTLESFKAAGTTEKGKALAYRWLELWSVWDRHGRPADLKPPDFTLMVHDPDRFETALLEIEEELTAPDPPQASD